MARTYYYYGMIRKTIIQFLDMFNDIQIARYASDGTTIDKYVEVPLKLGTKQKWWYWINERKDDSYLPIMSVTLNGIDYAPERQGNKYRELCRSRTPSAGEYMKYMPPTPYNFNFTLTIWSLHMVDIDQILEQILPFFTSETYIRAEIDELSLNMDMKVLFNGASPDTTFEFADEESRKIMWNLDFTVHSFLFRPRKSRTNMIKDVIIPFTIDDTAWSNRSTSTTLTSAGVSGAAETMRIYGVSPYFDSEGDKISQWEVYD